MFNLLNFDSFMPLYNHCPEEDIEHFYPSRMFSHGSTPLPFIHSAPLSDF